jgi:hypothetical protein
MFVTDQGKGRRGEPERWKIGKWEKRNRKKERKNGRKWYEERVKERKTGRKR